MCHICAISFFIHHTGPRWNQFLQFIQRLDHLLRQLTETEDSVVGQAIVGKDWAAQRLGYQVVLNCLYIGQSVGLRWHYLPEFTISGRSILNSLLLIIISLPQHPFLFSILELPQLNRQQQFRSILKRKVFRRQSHFLSIGLR